MSLPRNASVRIVMAITLIAYPTSAQANYSTTLNSPNVPQNGGGFAPGATITYAGSNSWQAGNQKPYGIVVSFYWTYYQPWNNAKNQTSGSLILVDSEYANIPTMNQYSLSFTSAAGKDYNNINQPSKALTAQQTNGNTSYYWVTAWPVQDNGLGFTNSDFSDTGSEVGWFYCR